MPLQPYGERLGIPSASPVRADGRFLSWCGRTGRGGGRAAVSSVAGKEESNWNLGLHCLFFPFWSDVIIVLLYK